MALSFGTTQADLFQDEMAAESVHQAAQSPAYELDDVPVKSVQVQLLTHEEASQADQKKILSTSATQTESQDISAGMSTHFRKLKKMYVLRCKSEGIISIEVNLHVPSC